MMRARFTRAAFSPSRAGRLNPVRFTRFVAEARWATGGPGAPARCATRSRRRWRGVCGCPELVVGDPGRGWLDLQQRHGGDSAVASALPRTFARYQNAPARSQPHDPFHQFGGASVGQRFGDTPIAAHRRRELPTEALAREAASRLCLCKGSILHAASRALVPASGMTVFLPRAAGARRLPVHGVDQRQPVNGRIAALRHC
jgi:hypothetical protein